MSGNFITQAQTISKPPFQKNWMSGVFRIPLQVHFLLFYNILMRISAHDLKLDLNKTEQLIFEGRHLPSIKGPVCRIYQDVGAEMESNIGNYVFICV